MAWNRQPPIAVQAPVPPGLGPWLAAFVVALLAGVLLFLVHAAQPAFQGLDVWVFSSAPLVLWALAVAGRAYLYGAALRNYSFCQEQALSAQQSWQHWAQRSMVACGSCVLLPDQISAAVLAPGEIALPSRTGLARRIARLPTAPVERVRVGFDLLFSSLTPLLDALPVDQPLTLTLLTDMPSEEHAHLNNEWQGKWAELCAPLSKSTVKVADQLSWQWIEDTLKSGSQTTELLVVLQVCGGKTYSDGLAALLLCPDTRAQAPEPAATGAILRPMPLNIEALNEDLAMLLDIQPVAREATGLLAGSLALKPVAIDLLVSSSAQQAALSIPQQWLLEPLWGVPGPLESWLMVALGLELARHREQPVLLLNREGPQHWITTVTSGART